MATRKFTVNFSQVNMLQNDSTFAELLEIIKNYKPEEKKSSKDIIINNIHSCKSIDGVIYTGKISKVRMSAIPNKLNIETCSVESLNMTNDEGLEELTAFMYISNLGILLTQKEQYGPTDTVLIDYCVEKFSLLPMEINPLLRVDELRKLKEMQKIVRIELKTARINPKVCANNSTVTDFLNTLDSTGYGTADIVFAAPKGDFLNISMKNLITNLANHVNGRYSKVTIKGDTPEHSGVILDLLEVKKVETVTVTLDSLREISLETRIEALQKAFLKNRSELVETYKS